MPYLTDPVSVFECIGPGIACLHHPHHAQTKNHCCSAAAAPPLATFALKKPPAPLPRLAFFNSLPNHLRFEKMPHQKPPTKCATLTPRQTMMAPRHAGQQRAAFLGPPLSPMHLSPTALGHTHCAHTHTTRTQTRTSDTPQKPARMRNTQQNTHIVTNKHGGAKRDDRPKQRDDGGSFWQQISRRRRRAVARRLPLTTRR